MSSRKACCVCVSVCLVMLCVCVCVSGHVVCVCVCAYLSVRSCEFFVCIALFFAVFFIEVFREADALNGGRASVNASPPYTRVSSHFFFLVHAVPFCDLQDVMFVLP